MSRLCAPFTILAAITAFGVDDGTSVELIPHKMAGDLVGGLVKCLFVRVIRQAKLPFGEMRRGTPRLYNQMEIRKAGSILSDTSRLYYII